MGLLCRADGEGRVYPRNLQAAAVLQILRQACQELGVTLACNWGVASLAREAGGFRLESAQGERLWCARCVLACGGKASPKHSWEGGGYSLAQALGHRVTELRPALTALKSLKKCLRSLKGMRVRAKASLLAAGKPLYQESGEVLFGEGSLSGICVFNLSAHLPEHVAGVEVSLDLLEDLPYRDALAYVESQAKAHPSRQAWELFAGALNLRVGEELLKELSVPKEACFQDLSRQQLRKAASLAKDWRFPVTGTGGSDSASTRSWAHSSSSDVGNEMVSASPWERDSSRRYSSNSAFIGLNSCIGARPLVSFIVLKRKGSMQHECFDSLTRRFMTEL